MPVYVDFDVTAAEEMLDDLTDRLDRPEGALRFLGDELLDYGSEVFATRGFGTWAADDPYTVKSKGSGRVLVDNGDLLDSLTGRSAVEISGDTVSVVSDDVAGIMAKRGARGAPKRDPFPVPSPTKVAGWAEDLLGFLVEGVGR